MPDTDTLMGIMSRMKLYADNPNIAMNMSPVQDSTSDRLRPPFDSPVPWLNITSAPASREAELGWPRIPEPYRNLMQTNNPGQTTLVHHNDPAYQNVFQLPFNPADHSWRGLFSVPHNGGGNWMSAVNPDVFGHEMVHALQQRVGYPKNLPEGHAYQVIPNSLSLNMTKNTKRELSADNIDKIRDHDERLSFTGMLPKWLQNDAPLTEILYRLGKTGQ